MFGSLIGLYFINIKKKIRSKKTRTYTMYHQKIMFKFPILSGTNPRQNIPFVKIIASFVKLCTLKQKCAIKNVYGLFVRL